MVNGSFVSWTDHGRSRDIAEEVDLFNYVPRSGKKLPLPIKYCVLSWKTWRFLRTRRPQYVFFLQPPAPLLVTAYAYAVATGGVTLLGDLHSGFFNDRKWSWFTNIGLRLLKRHHVLVTNEPLAEQIGSRVDDVHVLHDVLRPSTRSSGPVKEPYILLPLSYAADEPLESIMEAARATPEVTWKLTGRAPASLRARAGQNVEFTGFISNNEYEELLKEASAVLALTSRADTMQRAGYEALCANVPLLASDQVVLRQFFVDAAIYTDHDAVALAGAVKQTLDQGDELRLKSEALLELRMSEQIATLDQLRTLVNATN